MAKKQTPLSRDEVLSICQNEIESASGYASSELSFDRANAMDRYLGEPYGDEVDGRSQVRTREVLETVEMILPSLIRIFADADNLVEFDAVGPEDEEQAKLETEAVSSCFWKDNRGFYNAYTLIKDALLSKTGVLKMWVEEPVEEREEYEGISDIQLGQLMNDPEVEREPIEYERTEDGHHIVFKATPKRVKIQIEPVPPEEFGIASEARSPYIEDANFSYHRSKKTYSELIEAGYDADLIGSLPYDDDVDNEERLARRNLVDEQEALDWSSTLSMRTYWITECYIRVDMDGDGIAEQLKVTVAAGAYQASNAKLLDIEDVDKVRMYGATPIIQTHKFYGYSLADLVVDLQEISTIINRQILDSGYLSINGQTAVNTDVVNLDDLLTKRPGGLVRYDGSQPWSNVIGPIPHNPLPAETYPLLEHLEEMRKSRTGAGDDVTGLDAGALSNINTGVYARAMEAARDKIELIARIIAEITFRPLFRDIHELLQKNQNTAVMMRTQGKWAEINPSEWRTRSNTTVTVGVGIVSRERKLMALDAVMTKQQEVIQSGGMGTLLMPHQAYQTYADWTDAWGLEPALYWQDPRQLPPPQPQEPSAQDRLMEAQGQALMMDGQSKVQRVQLDAMKLQAEQQMQEREWQYKQQEHQMRMEIEGMKGRLAAIKVETEMQGKVASMEMEKDKQDTEAAISAVEAKLTHIKDERDRAVDIYKIQMDSLSKQLVSYGIEFDPSSNQERTEAMQQNERDKADREMARETRDIERERQAAIDRAAEKEVMGKIFASMVEAVERLTNAQEQANLPREITRDAKGLMTAVGGKPVVRDASGRVVSVG